MPLETEGLPIKWSSSIRIGAAVGTYSNGPVFSLLAPSEKEMLQSHILTRCRDMVGHYLTCSILEKEHSSYGRIKWSKEDAPLNPEKLELTVVLGKADSALDFDAESLEKIIHPVEKKMNIPSLTTIKEANAPTKDSRAWVVTADPFWKKAPPLFSAYLLLLRLTPYCEMTHLAEKLTIRQRFASRRVFSQMFEKEKDNSMVSNMLKYRDVFRRCILTTNAEFWNKEQEDYFELGATNRFTYLGLEFLNNKTFAEREKFCHKT